MVKEALSSVGWQKMFFCALLEQYQQEVEENGLVQCEEDYLVGWERLSGVLNSEQMELLEELEGHCEDETLIADSGVKSHFRKFEVPEN